MGEFRFHHCERRRVEQALPALLEGLTAEGLRIVVRAPSREMADALNDRLWTFDDASFLPHGGTGDGDPASQPIFLTDNIENPNGASVLVLLGGAETGPADADFAVAIRLFDGRDAETLAEARREWKRLKDAGAGAQLLARRGRGRLGESALSAGALFRVRNRAISEACDRLAALLRFLRVDRPQRANGSATASGH